MQAVIIHVCGSDGQPVGEFDETEFRDKIFAGAFLPDSFYWHEGMADWKPISDYRALAKTQKISFAPPMARTVRIDMESIESKAPTREANPRNPLARFWQRLTRH